MGTSFTNGSDSPGYALNMAPQIFLMQTWIVAICSNFELCGIMDQLFVQQRERNVTPAQVSAADLRSRREVE